MALDDVGDAPHVDDVGAEADDHAPRFLAAAIHRGAHEFYRLGQPLEHRLADQEVADIEFDHLRQCGDRLGGGVVETVAGMHLQPETLRRAPRRRG